MEHAKESSNKILAQALTGISFPATRDQIVEHAKGNGADKDTISVLQGMANDKGDSYNTMPDVFINAEKSRDSITASGTSSRGSDNAKGSSRK